MKYGEHKGISLDRLAQLTEDLPGELVVLCNAVGNLALVRVRQGEIIEQVGYIDIKEEALELYE